MFLNTNNGENNKIEDFLKSMEFIAPNGQSLKYFIIPAGQDTPEIGSVAQSNGFVQLPNDNQVKGVTDNIVYSKPDFHSRQSVSRPTFDPTAIPAPYPITKELNPTLQLSGNTSVDNNMKTDVLIAGGAILPPGSGVKTVKPDANITPIHVGNMAKPAVQSDNVNVPQSKAMTVVESTDKNFDFILNESVGIFPENTLFHVVRD